MTKYDIETPAVIIDESIALDNIKKYQTYCDQHGLQLRPHIKTHKLPYFAQAQIDAGAVGITCQKISEAEVMAEHGIEDILITYNILGAAKLRRLRQLSEKVARLAVVADSETVIDGLARTFESASNPLEVLIECDTGGARCGVQSVTEAVALADPIHQSNGLVLRGLMTYPPIDRHGQVQRFLDNARQAFRERSLPCRTVSSGGTPNMWQAHRVKATTEYRIGTYIYNDRSLLDSGVCSTENCALHVLATVVSTPTATRAVIDAGSKILTYDLNGLNNYGAVVGRNDLLVTGLSEEHGIVATLDGSDTGLSVGERVEIIPNHCCVVSNMVDSVHLYRHGDYRKTKVAARGCVT